MSTESPIEHTDLLAPVTDDDECCGGEGRGESECRGEGKGRGMGHGQGMGRGEGGCCGGQGRGDRGNGDAEKVTQPEATA
jgi:hypothetical protein